MASKKDLITTILKELRKAQIEKWTPPKPGPVKKLRFPPTLALGNGEYLKATEALRNAVYDYARLCWNNDPAIKPRFKIDELAKLAEYAIANVLAKTDSDRPDEDLVDEVEEEVRERLNEDLLRHRQTIELTVGCHLFEGDNAYPLRVGPVVFETREQWRKRLVARNKLSRTSARRLEAIWSGKPRRARKASADSQTEYAILQAIGECPAACTIETDGLSSKNIEEKGLLAARLAMSAISLMWERPSQGVQWMKLLYDRKLPNRHTVSFGEGKYPGSSSAKSEMPVGRWTDSELVSNLTENQWLLDQIGEALLNYVQPGRPVDRPKVMNAIFMSLLWFHEATREPLDQIATTKFAASMDALVGGKGERAIVKLLGAQLDYKPDGPLFKDGRTTKSVISKIYGKGRSRLIHGSSQDFADDWTHIRSSAEVTARLCLTTSCDWLYRNRNSDDLEGLQASIYQ
ncbi:hypothetical protein P7228_05755 [Altererythrobacter arenosus]|uniref:Apea-like HEPN domain-containing protein n=1 Tax=Altererythrobacter arenosus TaxID=3032592 RepID=A0ABY8FU81_9SPHN|nr:hypothetical protein [Altererythrobacter sp. CAU 1644]WFL78569.1 hypothetical protein P7228_05755 [Altererythrobacter sp. CAU 1644]